MKILPIRNLKKKEEKANSQISLNLRILELFAYSKKKTRN